jgi:spore germination cell wall hydrolase CwlJ-like protein
MAAEEDTEAEEEAIEVTETTEEVVEEVATYEASETETVATTEEQVETTTTETNEVSATTDDVTLLSALVYCEAGGESDEGKLAVASVVINRVNSGNYGNSIYDVIYAKGQFGPVTNGSLASALSNGVPSDCTQAATKAISGVNNVPGCYSFAPVSSVSGSGYTIIGNHAFY